MLNCSRNITQARKNERTNSANCKLEGRKREKTKGKEREEREEQASEGLAAAAIEGCNPLTLKSNNFPARYAKCTVVEILIQTVRIARNRVSKVEEEIG